MNSDKRLLRKQALINTEEYQQMVESLRLLHLSELDYVSIANILIKRKSSVEESAFKGILKQLGIPTHEIQTVMSDYLNNRKRLHDRAHTK